MVLEGSLFQILDFKEGIGKKGHWKKLGFVIKTFDQYPRHVVLNAWNLDAEFLTPLHIGDRISCIIEIVGREYNSKWYNDINASTIQLLDQPDEPPIASKAQTDLGTQGSLPIGTEDIDQDLPF